MKKILIYTDLDGTLLDLETYRFDAAVKAIEFLKYKEIPIIPCTSKTHPEVLHLRKLLKISDPFIVENGSAIFYPQNYFEETDRPVSVFNGYHAWILGKNYADIVKFFEKLKAKYNLDCTGFNEMDVEQIIRLTSLDMQEAEQAKQRFFSEPFINASHQTIPQDVLNEIQQEGFRLLRGNRFFHLLGNSDKGEAVVKLTELYRKKFKTENVVTIGIGDSMNDFEMLKNVDYPVLVRKHSGVHQDGLKLSRILKTDGIGPEGWQEAIFRLVDHI